MATPLRAGRLTMCLTPEGDLRHLRWDGEEVVRRIYAAVRDPNWGTVPARLSDWAVESGADRFRIAYTAHHRQESLDFVWQARIVGAPDGSVTFDFDGEARSTFLRNRIGFCVLHPADAAGALCTIEHVDGRLSTAALPETIDPDQPVEPFARMRALTQEMGSGRRVTVRFEGDTFEMEDQRNWTDASFKTFCTPLSLPFPVEVPSGTRIRQRIGVTLAGASSRPAATPTGGPAHLALRADAAPVPVPAIGLGTASAAAPVTETERRRLIALRLSYVRADARPGLLGWEERLTRQAQEARTIGEPLELALLLGDDPEGEAAAVRRWFDRFRPDVIDWLVFPAAERPGTPPDHARLLRAARSALEGVAPLAEFSAGTNADFLFLNRFPPPTDLVHALTFAITPQVHAFDDLSLVETLAAQAAAVRSARRLSGGRPVGVSPVTLLPRFNPYATTLTDPLAPPPVDPRQNSRFLAGWTVGSLKHLAESGVASATFFETRGPGGILEGERVFPVWQVLATLGEFEAGAVLPCLSSDPLAVEGIVLRWQERTCWLVANLTPEAQEVQVTGTPAHATCKILESATEREATQEPEAWRAKPGTPFDGRALRLSRHAIAWIEGTEEKPARQDSNL